MWLYVRLPEVLAALVKAVPKWSIRPGHKYLRRWWDAKAGRFRYEYYEAKHENDHRGADALIKRIGEGQVGVTTEYDPKIKDKLKGAGGRWNPEYKAWVFPVERYIEGIRHDFGHVVYTPNAQVEVLKHIRLKEVEPGIYEEESPLDRYRTSEDYGSTPIPPIPEGAVAKLHPEQVEDAQALLRAWARRFDDPVNPNGILLANGTGTGKTYVYAAFISALAAKGHRALVVVPNQDLVEQTEGVLSQFPTKDGDGKEVRLERGKHYLLVTHAALRDPEKLKELSQWLGKGMGNAIVLDEAHRFKNAFGSKKSKQGEGALELLRHTGAFAVYSTATPFDRPWEAKYLAFAGIHKATQVTAKNFDEWVQRYGVKVYEDRWGGKEYVFRGTVDDLVRLHDDLAKGGFLIKRLLRPEAPVAYEAPHLDLTPEDAQLLGEVGRRFEDAKGLVKALGVGLQRAILERAKARTAIPLIRQELQNGRSVAVFFQYLREKDLDPEALLETLLEEEGESGGSKIKKEFLERLQGLSIRLESPVRMVEEAFPDVPKAAYTGEQTEAQLRRAKEGFQSGQVRLLLLTGAKGGTGLSLHDTRGDRPTTQVIMSMPWTAIELDQILGRVVRRGLKSDVRILIPTTTAHVEKALAAVIGQRLRTLGYAVRGGETNLPPEILSAFEHGLAKLDPGRLQKRLEEIGQSLAAEAPAQVPSPEPTPTPEAPKRPAEPIPLLSPPPVLAKDPLQPALFTEVEAPTPPPRPKKRGKTRGTKMKRETQTPLFPPDMPLFEMAKALGIGPGTRLIIKAEERTIPVKRLKWVDRPRERKEVPASHFLMPKERKFPYKNKDGSINCALLRAAISRAAQHGYSEVERRARALYQRHCGKKGEE